MKKAIQLPLIIRDRRRRHWHWSPDIIVDLYGPLLGAGTLAIYCVLCRYADRDEIARPSIDKISELTGISKSQVRRELKEMEKYGLISVVQRGKLRLPNEYTLLDPPEEITFVRRATSETPNALPSSKHANKPPADVNEPPGRVPGEHLCAPTYASMTPDLIAVDVNLNPSLDHHHYLDPVSNERKKAPIDSEVNIIYSQLISMDIDPLVARDLAGSIAPDCLDAWIDYMGYHHDKCLGAGFLVQRLKAGVYPPGHRE